MLIYWKSLLHQHISLLQSNCSSCQPESANEHEDGNLLPMQWESSQTHKETQLQAEVIQDMLHSSVTPLDTPTRHQNRANVATFKQDILASNILQTQLTNYMWDSYITKANNDNWNRCDKTQVQKEEIVYSHDIDCNIVGAEDCLQDSTESSCCPPWQNPSGWTLSFS